ncbi:MAG TPA: MFS transporter, partial [Acidobacteriaceae bacterium]
LLMRLVPLSQDTQPARSIYSGVSPAMSDPDGNPPHPLHESAAPRLPLGEDASAASAALPEGAPPPRHSLHPVSGVVGVFLCGLVAFLTLYATQPLLPLFEALFHASKSAVGWTVSASTLGVAIAAPLLGTFTERMDRKRVILVSIVLLAVPTCAAATSTTSAGWSSGGCCRGSLHPASSPQRSPTSRRRGRPPRSLRS